MKKVAVIGGGLAGATTAREIRKIGGADVSVVLVEPKEYAEVPFAMLRAFVAPEALKVPVRRNLTEWLGVEQRMNRATALTDTTATLDDGTSLDFDAVVVATGSAVRGFDRLKMAERQTIAEREAQIASEHQRLAGAERVIVVGGGPVGVELAAEIVDEFPGKQVTMIQGADRLLPALSRKASSKALEFLQKAGAKVRLNERVELAKCTETSITFADGSMEDADLVYVATGVAPNSAFGKDGLGDAINDQGHFIVEPTLQLRNHPSVFVVGDANDTPEIKLGALAVRQAPVAAKNVIAFLSGGSLQAYKPMSAAIGFVTLGKKKGIAQLPFGHLDFMIAAKQKDFFARRMLK